MTSDNMGKVIGKIQMRQHPHRFRAVPSPVLTLMVVLALAAGCGSGSLTPGYRGKTLSYVQGLPDFDMDVRTRIDAGRPKVDLFLSVPEPSLTFVKTAGVFVARYEVTLVLGRTADEVLGAEWAWQDTSAAPDYAGTVGSNRHSFVRSIPAEPGSYVCYVGVEDLNSGKKASRQQDIIVPDPASGQPSMSGLRINECVGDGRSIPFLPFFIQERIDSLAGEVHLFNLPKGTPVSVDILLEQLEADTSIARPPYAYSILQSNAGYRLLRADRPDTLLFDHHRVVGEGPDQTVCVGLPRMGKGIYRFTATTKISTETRDTVLSSTRLLSVQGPGFPRPMLLSEMIEALAYITPDGAMDQLRSAQSAVEKKRLFDSVWISFAGDRAGAALLLARYYSRVEEANRAFTTTKEGWRTDRGMLFVVLGAPAEVTAGFDTQIWYYSLPGDAASNAFSLKRSLSPAADDMVFENYVLLRSEGYERIWDRMVNAWRSGRVF